MAALGFVLVVDDDPDVRMTLHDLLAKRGFEVRCVESAADAIALMEYGDRPALVLADVVMPGIIGTSLVDYMKADPQLARIPIAFVTGSPNLVPPDSTVFCKPVSIADIVAFLEGNGMQRAHNPRSSASERSRA